MSQNYILLKVVKVAHFMLWVFYHKKKKGKVDSEDIIINTEWFLVIYFKNHSAAILHLLTRL